MTVEILFLELANIRNIYYHSYYVRGWRLFLEGIILINLITATYLSRRKSSFRDIGKRVGGGGVGLG